ncbi:MAG: universal stress protein [Bacteroidales bacterium]
MKERLVTLATDHYTSAEILKAKLEDAGIECFLKNVNLLQGAVSEGVKLQIKESDVEKALRIITNMKAEQERKEKKDIKKLRRVLVPVDFSEFSENACLYALELAKKYDADLKILHVFYAPIVDLVPITDAYSIQVDMDINLRELENQAKEKLTEFVARIKKTASEKGMGDIKISYSLREGIVEDEVASMAAAYKPGIIVMGTKGKGEKQSDIIGSVVYRVLDKTRVPVLAIPEKTKPSSFNDVNNIVYATRFDDSDYVAIRRLLSIVTALNVKIFCVHVSKDAEDNLLNSKMNSLKDYFKRIHEKIQIETHFLKGDDQVANLEKFCEQHKIDIISLSSKKRSLLQRLFKSGLTKKLISNSSIPLLLFK